MQIDYAEIFCVQNEIIKKQSDIISNLMKIIIQNKYLEYEDMCDGFELSEVDKLKEKIFGKYF